jgi:hypothetical protein
MQFDDDLCAALILILNMWYVTYDMVEESCSTAIKRLRSKKGRLVQQRRYTPPSLRHQPPRNSGNIIAQLETIYESNE